MSRRALHLTITLSALAAVPSPAQVRYETDKYTHQGAQYNEWLGSSVGVTGGWVIAGAPGLDFGFSHLHGGAFAWNGPSSSPPLELNQQVPTEFGGIGTSMATSGGCVLVGKPRMRAGEALLYDLATGAELALFAPTPGVITSWAGGSVALDGNRAVLGAHREDMWLDEVGAAYVFDIVTGQQTARFTHPHAVAERAHFGWSVALSGDLLAVGAPGNQFLSGSVHLFDLSTGSLLTSLAAPHPRRHDSFGFSLDTDGAVLLVGARYDSTRASGGGAAYLFDVAPQSAGFGTLVHHLSPSSIHEGCWFG